MLTHFQVAGLTPAALSFSDAPQVFPRVFKNSFNLLEFPEKSRQKQSPFEIVTCKSVSVGADEADIVPN